MVPRRTKTKGTRYHVRFELGREGIELPDGRVVGILHLGAFDNPTEAKKRKRWALDEYAAGRIPNPDAIGKPVHGLTMRQAAADWIESRVDIQNLTQRGHRQKAERIGAHFGDQRAKLVTRHDVQDYVAMLIAKGYKPGTIGQYVTVLRQILDDADADPNPARDKRIRRPIIESGGRMRLIGSSDLNRIEAEIRLPIDRVLLRFLEQTGARISEAVKVRWRDIDHAERRVRILGTKARGGRPKPRWVADDERAPVALPVRPEGAGDDDLVFAGRYRAFPAALEQACVRAGVMKISPHDLRHLHASRLVKAGMDPVSVAARLGHVKPSITLDVYSHLDVPE